MSGVGSAEHSAPEPVRLPDAPLAARPESQRPRVLLVVSVQPPDALAEEVAAGRQPERDYRALRSALQADALYPQDAQRDRWSRLVARLLGARAALAWVAYTRRRAYDVIFTDTELVGLPLALLLKVSRSRAGRPRHVMLAHYLSPTKKRLMFRLGVASHIDRLIVHGAAQRDLAIHQLHVPARKVAKLPYLADTAFWRPELGPGRDAASDAGEEREGAPPLICSTGMERRDYATLLEAVDGLNVRLRLTATNAQALQAGAARSAQASTVFDHLPNNVRIAPCASYTELRSLYQRSRFVVVPLQDVDFPAGITVILEAMAMGKAVIVTSSRGQTDVVRDPRQSDSELAGRGWQPGFLDESAYADTLGRLPTGLYVAPGDVAALRAAIVSLLETPALAAELGANGRTVVEAYFTLTAFTQRFAAAIWPGADSADSGPND